MLLQVSRSELEQVRSCKTNLNKMMARVLELKQVIQPALPIRVISGAVCHQSLSPEHFIGCIAQW